MFINRRRDRIKVIWWDRDGLAIFMKRLEAGTIQKPIIEGNAKSLIIDHAQSRCCSAASMYPTSNVMRFEMHSEFNQQQASSANDSRSKIFNFF